MTSLATVAKGLSCGEVTAITESLRTCARIAGLQNVAQAARQCFLWNEITGEPPVLRLRIATQQFDLKHGRLGVTSPAQLAVVSLCDLLRDS